MHIVFRVCSPFAATQGHPADKRAIPIHRPLPSCRDMSRMFEQVTTRTDFDAGFIVRCELAQGSDGKVFRIVRKGQADKSYVMKLEKTHTDSERDVDLMVQASGHKHVVALLAAFTWSRSHRATIFEEADCDLRKFLRLHGRSEQVAIDVGQQVGSGLAHLHFLKIAHRDLKLANVLVFLVRRAASVAARGNPTCPYDAVYRICDLSRSRRWQEIKKRVSKKRPPPHVEYACMTPGLCTPVYSAPELWDCSGEALSPYGPAADV